ncbi:hypothetical protein GGI35DRAFT_179561 [Trichoderma velutinum]
MVLVEVVCSFLSFAVLVMANARSSNRTRKYSADSGYKMTFCSSYCSYRKPLPGRYKCLILDLRGEILASCLNMTTRLVYKVNSANYFSPLNSLRSNTYSTTRRQRGFGVSLSIGFCKCAIYK